MRRQLIWRTSFLLVFFLITFLFLGAKLIFWQLLQGRKFPAEIRRSPAVVTQEIILENNSD
ncbi:MAG TPA: hypothetical protein GX711_02680 [Clostridia bacterium]|nr:hypothetical protein [Clostridia bacterium]